MRFAKSALVLCLALGFTATANAQSGPTLAKDGLQPVIDHLSQDTEQNSFELGMLTTLRAVEKSLQTRYRYGMGDRLSALMLLRIRMGPVNPQPEPSRPDTLTRLFENFLNDMDTARTSLAAAAPNAFELTLQDLWFDVNGDGERGQDEDIIEALGPIILGGQYRELTRSGALEEPITVRFDAADHAWLTAYTHMLSGFGNLYMAFDPSPVLANLETETANLANVPVVPNFYDQDALRAEIEKLEADLEELRKQQDAVSGAIGPLRAQMQDLRRQMRQTEIAEEKAELAEQIDTLEAEMRPFTEERLELNQTSFFLTSELAAAEAKLDTGPTPIQNMLNQERGSIDMVYVVISALKQQPDAAHIGAAHDHWRAMITENRRFWGLLAEEADNDREWIPNPQQVSALGIDVPANTAQAWQNILTDAEAVLEGKLLVPHPLLPGGHGISIPAYVADPAPLDLISWVHGIGAYPYVARGPRISNQSWTAFQRLTGGNAGGFALFFN